MLSVLNRRLAVAVTFLVLLVGGVRRLGSSPTRWAASLKTPQRGLTADSAGGLYVRLDLLTGGQH